jgi:hypothetical protein
MLASTSCGAADAQAHGDRADVLADADAEGTSKQGPSQGYVHGHPRGSQIKKHRDDHDFKTISSQFT